MSKFFKLIPVVLSVCLYSSSYGKSVDENTAKNVGSNFLISREVPGVKTASDLVTSYVATAQVGGATVNDYYVFNVSGGTGFVMVSGDDLVIPILAYSKDRSFNINNIGPEAKFWIEGYQNQITAVIANSVPAKAGTSDKWSDLTSAAPARPSGARTTLTTGPLLTTTWNQAPNYNYLCPGSGTGQAVTGCVATAMAQVMKFWNWPMYGTGYHGYTSTTMGYNLSADFGKTMYDWSGMPNSIVTNNYAIGLLMLHAGISVNMDYTASESGSYVIELESPQVNCAEFAMKTYFHYSPSLIGIPRSGETGGLAAVPEATWITKIEAEINAGRPVIYSGTGGAGGHCWVCDGYDPSDNEMHFNFGWGGITGSDGYYTVDNIAPSALGIGGGAGNFNTDQCIIIGIQPDSLPHSTTGNIKMLAPLDCPSESPLTYDGAFSVSTKLINSGTTTFTGQFCVQMFDVNNNLAGTVQTMTGETITAGDSTATLTFSTTGIRQMIPGSYTMKIMYRTSSTGAWTAVANNGVFVNFNEVDVYNSQLIELYDSMKVTPATGLAYRTFRDGDVLTMTTQLVNFGNSNFSGTVQAVLVNVATGTSYTVQQFTGQSIHANYTSGIFTFTSSPLTAPEGTYVLAVQHEPSGTGSFIYTGSDLYENPIIVYILGPASVPSLSASADKIVVYPNPATDMVNINLNGVSLTEVRISDMEGHQLFKMTPATNQSVVNVPVGNFASGMYLVELQSGNEVITKKIVVAK